MKIKYAIHAFRASFAFKNFTPRVIFSGNTYLETAEIEALFHENSDIAHWKEWLGTTGWEGLLESAELIVSWMPTENADILDNENNDLLLKNDEVIRSLPAVTGHAFSFDEVHRITGQGELIDGEVRILDIRSVGSIAAYARSCWIARSFNDPFFDHQRIVSNWVTIHKLIGSEIYQAKRDQLLECLRSFEEAYRTYQLEFKIPNLVRAVEALVDCWGSKEFAEKLIWYIGSPPDEEVFHLNADYNLMLENLYQLRNDCSHGKPIDWSLKKNNPGLDIDKEIPRYEYLAEWIAQKVFWRSLQPDVVTNFKDRSQLVTFWKDYKNNVPSA